MTWERIVIEALKKCSYFTLPRLTECATINQRQLPTLHHDVSVASTPAVTPELFLEHITGDFYTFRTSRYLELPQFLQVGRFSLHHATFEVSNKTFSTNTIIFNSIAFKTDRLSLSALARQSIPFSNSTTSTYSSLTKRIQPPLNTSINLIRFTLLTYHTSHQIDPFPRNFASPFNMNSPENKAARTQRNGEDSGKLEDILTESRRPLTQTPAALQQEKGDLTSKLMKLRAEKKELQEATDGTKAHTIAAQKATRGVIRMGSKFAGNTVGNAVAGFLGHCTLSAKSELGLTTRLMEEFADELERYALQVRRGCCRPWKGSRVSQAGF